MKNEIIKFVLALLVLLFTFAFYACVLAAVYGLVLSQFPAEQKIFCGVLVIVMCYEKFRVEFYIEKIKELRGELISHRKILQALYDVCKEIARNNEQPKTK
jgi:hypothetical protein